MAPETNKHETVGRKTVPFPWAEFSLRHTSTDSISPYDPFLSREKERVYGKVEVKKRIASRAGRPHADANDRNGDYDCNGLCRLS